HDRCGDVLEALEAVERILRLHRDGANERVVLFQAPRVADERARGAKPGDEVRDASRCLREDFYRSALVMSAPVGRIRVLVGIEVLAGILRDELADKEDRAVRALAGLAINDLGAVGRDQGLAL